MVSVWELIKDQSLHQSVAEVWPAPELWPSPIRAFREDALLPPTATSAERSVLQPQNPSMQHAPAPSLPNWEMKLTCRKICCSLSIQLLYHGVNTSIPPVSQRTKCSVNNIMKRCRRGEKKNTYSVSPNESRILTSGKRIWGTEAFNSNVRIIILLGKHWI